jgi:hypothetical protein
VNGQVPQSDSKRKPQDRRHCRDPTTTADRIDCVTDTPCLQSTNNPVRTCHDKHPQATSSTIIADLRSLRDNDNSRSMPASGKRCQIQATVLFAYSPRAACLATPSIAPTSERSRTSHLTPLWNQHYRHRQAPHNTHRTVLDDCPRSADQGHPELCLTRR